MDYDGSIILGDLNTQTIHEVYSSPKLERIRQMHMNGEGDKIKLCKDINCVNLFRDSATLWWLT